MRKKKITRGADAGEADGGDCKCSQENHLRFPTFCFSLFHLFHQEGHLCFHFSTFVGLSLSLVSSHLTVKPPVTHLPQILIASNSPTTLYCLTLGSKWVGEPDYSPPDTGKLYSGHLVASQLVSESEQDFHLFSQFALVSTKIRQTN